MSPTPDIEWVPKTEADSLRARVSELESALRTHLAVAPDDPILVTPAEQQLVSLQERICELEGERDAAREDNARVRAMLDEILALSDIETPSRDGSENVATAVGDALTALRERAQLAERRLAIVKDALRAYFDAFGMPQAAARRAVVRLGLDTMFLSDPTSQQAAGRKEEG